MHSLVRVQQLPISLDEAWSFFASPNNLKTLTPSYMRFDVTSTVDVSRMYEGMLITYIVTPILNIPMRWATEITHVTEGKYFIDNQKSGPYKVWHHQHHFKTIEGGVEMTDILHYELPFGILGRFIHAIMVGKKVNDIFDYRYQKLIDLFGKMK